MNSSRASDLANYALAALGPQGGQRRIRLISAAYDDATRSITLRPAHLLSLRGHFRLTTVGRPPGGLASSEGLFLDGAGTGQAGTDHVKAFGREAAMLPAC